MQTFKQKTCKQAKKQSNDIDSQHDIAERERQAGGQMDKAADQDGEITTFQQTHQSQL
jgi:hypothetical protein